MSLLFDLFLSFFKIGLFTFGSGYAMIALIENACVEKKRWITHDEMMTITAIALSTPGPIAINCATYVGYKQKGFRGSVAATLGVILPSFCIIFAISLFLDRFLEITWIARAFQGIKIAVGILILDAALKMLKKTENPDVKYLHCLPSFHDFETKMAKEWKEKGVDIREVEDEVFRSRHSVVFDEAENRMHSIKALLVATIGK